MAEKQEEKEREGKEGDGKGKGKGKGGGRCGTVFCTSRQRAWSCRGVGRLSMNQLSMKKMSSLNNCPIEVLGLSSPLLLASTSLNLLMMFITFRAE